MFLKKQHDYKKKTGKREKQEIAEERQGERECTKNSNKLCVAVSTDLRLHF